MISLRFIAITLFVSIVFGQEPDSVETDLSCESCHSGTVWTLDVGQNFSHITTGFELVGSHADLNCNLCHTGSTPAEKHDFSRVVSECSSCHEDIHNDQWGQDCERCHTPDSWGLSTQQQNHDLTNFPLRGPHRSMSCDNCHVNSPSTTTTLPLDCGGCHSNDYAESITPPHQLLELSNDCESCHAPQATQWSNSNFDHNSTTFNLLGMHAQTACTNCHTENVSNAPRLCRSCHIEDYNASQDPAHLEAGYPVYCRDCHDSFTWNSSFIHDETGFVLAGVHASLLCVECHPSQSFDDTPQRCSGCHETEWTSTTTPSHEDAGFDLDCRSCHSEVDWTPALWDHSIDANYPFTGAHIGLSCEQCHLSVPYTDQTSKCYDCHKSDYENSLEPNHVTSDISTACIVCHTTINWETTEIDHDLTDFPLVGAHIIGDCEVCHSSGYDLPILCDGCHADDYQKTFIGASPNHEQFEFSVECETCHTQFSWVPSTFDHDASVTGFEVLGAHLALLPNDCGTCHQENQWSGIDDDCSECHRSDFNHTADPDHTAYGYPANICETCHSQDAWDPSIFAHETSEISCESCHLVQYNNTTEPPHEVLDFPTDCADCHSSDNWTPSTFNHDVETTGFLSDGAHEPLSCSSCHDSWEPVTEVRTCASASCHLDNFQTSTNPPHEVMSFSQSCEDCHSTDAWTPTQFVHDDQSTGFVLAGAHTSVECQQCHNPWQIVPDPRTCADGSCHLPDYQTTTDPDHESASFPLDCESCHTETAWEPATFNHDGENFPIYSGQHRNEWNDCSQCHPDPSDFGIFTCFGSGCHSVGEMNSEHCEGGDCESCNGITYPTSGVTPEDCLTCHPNGDEDDCGGDLLNFFKLRTLPQPTESVPYEKE